jgi:bifunctional non-homologous end joining protein LigD
MSIHWRPAPPSRRPPGFIEACIPTLAHRVPSGPQWVHEIKHDGLRFICRRDGNRVRVFSRDGHDWTDWVPAIVEALAGLKLKSATIDGEGVLCGSDGISDFLRLRAALRRQGSRRGDFVTSPSRRRNVTQSPRRRWQAAMTAP